MEHLYDEILLEIFRKLDVHSIINLTLVCKKFNFLISHCGELLKNVEISVDLRNLHWSEKVQRRGSNARDLCVETILNSTRKYGKLKVSSYNSEKIFIFIEKFGKDLKSFSLHGSINERDFLRVLEKLPNLEKGVFNVDVYRDSDHNEEFPAICKNLVYLKCESELNFFLEVFQKSVYKLKEIEFNGYKVFDDYNVQNFKNFLIHQSHLKSLKLHCLHATDLFSTEFSPLAPFQLDYLEIKDLAISNRESRRNYIKFLGSQKSLKKINILSTDWNTTEPEIQDDLIECLLRLQQLEFLYLNLNRCEFKSLNFSRVNPTIKTLIFKNQDSDVEQISDTLILEKFVHSMPALQTFEFVSSVTANFEDLNCLNNLCCLENLTIRDCTIDSIKNLRLPKLRMLKLCAYDEDEDEDCDDINYDNDWMLFFERHPLITKFIFNLEFNEFLLEKLFKYLKNLENLQLTISSLEAAQTILKNYKSCTNLKFIKIDVEPPKCSKFLQNIEEFCKLFGIHGFKAERCGIYTDYLQFTKSM